MTIGGLRGGYHALMGTSPGVTVLAQPCFRLTVPGMLLKQWDNAAQLYVLYFKAIFTLFVVLDYMLLNSSSRFSLLVQQLELYRGWKWYVGRLGEGTCLNCLTNCSALVCSGICLCGQGTARTCVHIIVWVHLVMPTTYT